MIYSFEFSGGTRKPDSHSLEKFLLFFLVGEKEIPFYQLVKDGLVYRAEDANPHKFITGQKIAKLFVAEQGFGRQKRYHSFYCELQETACQEVTIRSFLPGSSPFFFKGGFRFMKKQEVLAMLPAGMESRSFIARQETLPLDLLRKMISVDHTEERKNVRFVMVGDKKFEQTIPF